MLKRPLKDARKQFAINLTDDTVGVCNKLLEPCRALPFLRIVIGMSMCILYLEDHNVKMLYDQLVVFKARKCVKG